MSGHSKWANIKHHKAANDAKKAKVFSKYARYVTIAAKEGGGDPAVNFKLRLMIDKAKAAGMPNDNIDRAIKRGTGEEKGADITSALYEGLGPAGSAFLVEVATDNTNRSLSDVRQAFSKNGGQLGNGGSVAWMFDQVGVILAVVDQAKREAATFAAIDSGSLDVIESPEGLEIHTDPKYLGKAKEALDPIVDRIETAEIAWIAKQTLRLTDAERSQIEKISNALDQIDDVVEVYTNLD